MNQNSLKKEKELVQEELFPLKIEEIQKTIKELEDKLEKTLYKEEARRITEELEIYKQKLKRERYEK